VSQQCTILVHIINYNLFITMFNKNILQQTFSFLAVGSMMISGMAGTANVNADGGGVELLPEDVNLGQSFCSPDPIEPGAEVTCTFDLDVPANGAAYYTASAFVLGIDGYTTNLIAGFCDLEGAAGEQEMKCTIDEGHLLTQCGDYPTYFQYGGMDPLIIPMPDFKINVCDSPFSDVKPGETFTGHIIALYNDGVIGGYSDGTFKPTGDVTRGAMAKFIYNAFEYTPNTSCGDFTDVSNSSGFYTYITTLKCEGVIGGYSDGSFKPSGKINRGATTKFIVNARRDKNLSLNEDTTNTPKFLDVSESNVFYEYIMMSRENNIIGGYSNNTFKPDDVVTRGAMSKIVDNGRKD
jgi:hypothetical protein